MKHFLAAAGILLSTMAAAGAPREPAGPPCVMCSDQLRKDLVACRAEDPGDARDLCRANARRKAKTCADNQGPGACNVDLILDPPPEKHG